MRSLTSKFGTYRLGKYEKKTGKSIMDIINIDNFEINKIVELIKLGSPEINMEDDEKAYDKLDKYLETSDENSLITAYIDLLNDINTDLKLFMGIDMNELKAKLKNEVKALANMDNEHSNDNGTV